MTVPLLSVSGLSKTFRSGGREVAALDNVSLDVFPGETLGLVGPSGSGKSTLARVIMRLVSADAGSILFDGVDLLSLEGARLRQQRKRLQMVFQDPLAAFNPRATVASALDDPLRIHRIVPAGERRRASEQLLERVGLPTEFITRSIHEISGGQRQRVAIARALVLDPEVLVLDEAVSALDVTVQAQILKLLDELQRELGLTYLFVSHDLAVVRQISDTVSVLQNGRQVESGTVEQVFAHPQSAYTRELIDAIPGQRSHAVA